MGNVRRGFGRARRAVFWNRWVVCWPGDRRDRRGVYRREENDRRWPRRLGKPARQPRRHDRQTRDRARHDHDFSHERAFTHLRTRTTAAKDTTATINVIGENGGNGSPTAPKQRMRGFLVFLVVAGLAYVFLHQKQSETPLATAQPVATQAVEPKSTPA